jgi:phage repressor protein C with HTH and peptisase S24 domain
MGRKREDRVEAADLSGFSERLRQVMGRRSQTEFAEAARLSQAGVHRLLKGGSPTLDTLLSIAEATGCSIEWLATGKSVAPSDGGAVSVPRLPFRAAAGGGAYVGTEDAVADALPASVLTSLGLPLAAARGLVVTGDSMAPSFPDGSLVVVDTRATAPVEGAVFVFSIEDQVFLKRLRRMPGWHAVSEAADVPPWPLPTDGSLRFIGRVRWRGGAV